MVATIGQHTGAKLAIGQNGRIWVDGSPEAIRRVSEVLRIIDEEGQRPGLTDRVESYLLATMPPNAQGREEPPRESARRDTADEEFERTETTAEEPEDVRGPDDLGANPP